MLNGIKLESEGLSLDSQPVLPVPREKEKTLPTHDVCPNIIICPPKLLPELPVERNLNAYMYIFFLLLYFLIDMLMERLKADHYDTNKQCLKI